MRKRTHSKTPVEILERPEPLTRTQALSAIGQVVYAARFDDGTIKIGCTTDLAVRLRKLLSRDGRCEIVALKPGDFDDERAIHDRLIPHRSKGREFYHPTREVVAVVNEMREGVGLPPLAA